MLCLVAAIFAFYFYCSHHLIIPPNHDSIQFRTIKIFDLKTNQDVMAEQNHLERQVLQAQTELQNLMLIRPSFDRAMEVALWEGKEQEWRTRWGPEVISLVPNANEYRELKETHEESVAWEREYYQDREEKQLVGAAEAEAARLARSQLQLARHSQERARIERGRLERMARDAAELERSRLAMEQFQARRVAAAAAAARAADPERHLRQALARSFDDHAPRVRHNWRLIDPSLHNALGELSRHGLGATGTTASAPQQSQQARDQRIEQQRKHKSNFPVQFQKAFGPAQKLRFAFEQHGLNAIIDPKRLSNILDLQAGHPDIQMTVSNLDRLSANQLLARPIKERDTPCCACTEALPLPVLVCRQCGGGTCLSCVQKIMTISNRTECAVCRTPAPWLLHIFK